MADEGMLDPGTRRTIASGRAAVGEVVSTAQHYGRRLFVVFVIGLLGTIYAMQTWIWPQLKADLLARGATIIAITPFDVILLQAKIGIVVGLLLDVPLILYYVRGPLKERNWYPEEGIGSVTVAALLAVATVLFTLGVLYSYKIFFPLLFKFLADNALQAGLAPTYSIVDWTQFIITLALSFGIAAETPLAMGTLTYLDIVPYLTFRKYWKHTVVVIFALGALLTPPDVFTQLMMATPLLGLYTISLGVSKLVSRFSRRRRAREAATPAAIDLDELNAAGVRAAPAEAFAALGEEDALAMARRAMDADQPEKARAILDRFDEAQAVEAEDGQVDETELEALADEGTDGATRSVDDRPATGAGGGAGAGGGLGATFQRTTAGLVDAFTEEETTEDDIGGYFYDIVFVLDSVRSKGFLLFGLFIAVVISVFTFLYSGGIGYIKNDFLRRLPSIVRPEDVKIVTLHPVEALVFEVKMAILLGLVAVLPAVLYMIWPPLQERGLVGGDRNVFFGWAGALFAGLIGGSAIGYLFVAPAVVSYFVWDALQANMIIAYRVSNFFWLVFFTTVGIGLFVDIPVTMLLFHRGGIVTYAQMRAHWRVVTLGVLVFAAAFTPASVLSMILVTIPIMLAYGLGLGVLWVYTLGGRRTPRGAAESG